MWAICLNIYCFVLSFRLLLHRLAERISLPFYIFLQVLAKVVFFVVHVFADHVENKPISPAQVAN